MISTDKQVTIVCLEVVSKNLKLSHRKYVLILSQKNYAAILALTTSTKTLTKILTTKLGKILELF